MVPSDFSVPLFGLKILKNAILTHHAVYLQDGTINRLADV